MAHGGKLVVADFDSVDSLSAALSGKSTQPADTGRRASLYLLLSDV